jgi:hypothetical protein
VNYEVQPSRLTPDEWVVEAIDHDSEGEIYAALFSGPGAQGRAEEYATWKTLRALAERRWNDLWNREAAPTFV